MSSILPPDEKLAQLEDRVTYLESQAKDLDTQIDAVETAIAALQTAKKNKAQLNELSDRLEAVIRGFQAFACVVTGAALLWFANPLINDVIPNNDAIGEWLLRAGLGCIAYGLLVLTSNDRTVLGWLESINPWKR